MKEITVLRNTYPKQIEGSNNNEKIPSQFICPLTKEVMSEPVIAFDENVYERAAIQEYLEKYKKSPVTEEAFDFHLFPDMQLKVEIKQYLKVRQNISTNTEEVCNVTDDLM